MKRHTHARNPFEDLNSAHAHFERSKLIRMSVYAWDCKICEKRCMVDHFPAERAHAHYQWARARVAPRVLHFSAFTV